MASGESHAQVAECQRPYRWRVVKPRCRSKSLGYKIPTVSPQRTTSPICTCPSLSLSCSTPRLVYPRNTPTTLCLLRKIAAPRFTGLNVPREWEDHATVCTGHEGIGKVKAGQQRVKIPCLHRDMRTRRSDVEAQIRALPGQCTTPILSDTKVINLLYPARWTLKYEETRDCWCGRLESRQKHPRQQAPMITSA